MLTCASRVSSLWKCLIHLKIEKFFKKFSEKIQNFLKIISFGLLGSFLIVYSNFRPFDPILEQNKFRKAEKIKILAKTKYFYTKILIFFIFLRNKVWSRPMSVYFWQLKIINLDSSWAMKLSATFLAAFVGTSGKSEIQTLNQTVWFLQIFYLLFQKSFISI